jgi:hypothetical protein
MPRCSVPPHTRRNYAKALDELFTFCASLSPVGSWPSHYAKLLVAKQWRASRKINLSRLLLLLLLISKS